MHNTLEVPQSALSLPGPEGNKVMPEKGDPVSFHVEGTIRKVHEGWCEVQIKFINGKRPGPEEGEFIDTEEGDTLTNLAKAADASENY